MNREAKIGFITVALISVLAGESVCSADDEWRFKKNQDARVAFVQGEKGAVLEYRCSYERYEGMVTWWNQFENVNQQAALPEAGDALQCGVVLKTPAGGCIDSGLQVVDIRSFPFHMVGEFGCRRHENGTDYTFFHTTEERLREPLMNGAFIHFDVGEQYAFTLKGSHRAIRAARGLRR